MRWDRVFFTFAERFGWTPDQVASLPVQHVTMLFNCMIEESDKIKDAQEGIEHTNDSMSFKPKHKGAIDLSKLSIDQLHKTLEREFGTSQGTA